MMGKVVNIEQARKSKNLEDNLKHLRDTAAALGRPLTDSELYDALVSITDERDVEDQQELCIANLCLALTSVGYEKAVRKFMEIYSDAE